MPHRLSRIEPDEISLVDLPAIKRKFLFKKAADKDKEGFLICDCGHKEALIDFLKSASEECPNCGESLLDSATKIIFKGDHRMKKLSELLIDFIGGDELEDEDIEKFEKAEKKMSPEAVKSLKGALNILKKFKAEFPDDVKEAINTLAKYAAYGYGYPAKKSDEEDEDVEKAGAKLSKATRELIRSVVDKSKILEKAVKALETLVKDDAQKSAEVALIEEKMDELTEKIDKLLKKKKTKKGYPKDLEEKEEEEEEEEEEAKEAEKEIKKLQKRIKNLEEKKGTKKSLKGQDEDEEEVEDEDEEKQKTKKSKPWSFNLAKTESED